MSVTRDQNLQGTALTPAGSTQADAAEIHRRDMMTISGFTAGQGVKLVEAQLERHQHQTVHNGADATASSTSAYTLQIYPWSGAAFNGQAANAALTLPAGKGAMFVYLNSTKIGVIFS